MEMPVNSLLNGCWEKENYYIQKIKGRSICHESWKEMIPNSENRTAEDIFEEYFRNIQLNKRLAHIPKEVFFQWLYPFSDDINSLANYAWIDFYKASFSLEEFDLNTIINHVHPNKKGSETVTIRSRCKDFSDFYCDDDVVEYWMAQGTWRMPPVVLDVLSFPNIPEWVDYSPPYQLVEGHNRLGYLHANFNMKNNRLKKRHQIYVLRASELSI